MLILFTEDFVADQLTAPGLKPDYKRCGAFLIPLYRVKRAMETKTALAVGTSTHRFVMQGIDHSDQSIHKILHLVSTQNLSLAKTKPVHQSLVEEHTGWRSLTPTVATLCIPLLESLLDRLLRILSLSRLLESIVADRSF